MPDRRTGSPFLSRQSSNKRDIRIPKPLLSGTLNPHLPYGRAKHTYEEELAANNAARASAAEHEGEPRKTRFHGVRLDDR